MIYWFGGGFLRLVSLLSTQIVGVTGHLGNVCSSGFLPLEERSFSGETGGVRPCTLQMLQLPWQYECVMCLWVDLLRS